MKIVALSGSLRARSSNAALLRAAAAVAPPPMEVVVYEGLGELPHFNPDLDEEGAVPPAPVKALRELLGAARGVLVSSPEYAHGVPGSFKNALDWIVSSGELAGKPVLLINGSGGGQHARAALLATLTVIEARVLVDATVQAPLVRTAMSPDGTIRDPEIIAALRRGLDALAAAIAEAPPAAGG